jgi:hypothetical protein
MRTRLTIALLATAGLLAAAAPAQGAVTIGSSLATANNGSNMPGCGASCTATQLALNAANQASGGLRSPVNGTVTGYRFNANVGVNISLRVLRPGTGTAMTGVATSAAAGFAGPGTSPLIPTSLPIQVGDAVGLNNPDTNFIFGTNINATNQTWFAPPLANGETRMATAVGNQSEVLVQAVVEPSNTLTFGQVTRNKKKGTAELTVNVPNPGLLTVTATGGTATLVGGGIAVPRGPVKFAIRATGKKAKGLKKKGKAGVGLTFVFTPTDGTANPQTTNVGLKRKVKKLKKP